MSTLGNDFSNQIAERLRLLAMDYDENLQAKIQQLLKRESNIGLEATMHDILRKIAAIAAKEKNNQDLWQQIYSMLSEVAKVDHRMAESLKGLNIMHANENARKAAQDKLLAILRDQALADSLAQHFSALPKSKQDMIKSRLEAWCESVGSDANNRLQQAAYSDGGFVGKQLIEGLFLMVEICIGINNPEGLQRLQEHMAATSQQNDNQEKVRFLPPPPGAHR